MWILVTCYSCVTCPTGKNFNRSVLPADRDEWSPLPTFHLPFEGGEDGLLKATDAVWVAFCSHKVKKTCSCHIKVIISTSEQEAVFICQCRTNILWLAYFKKTILNYYCVADRSWPVCRCWSRAGFASVLSSLKDRSNPILSKMNPTWPSTSRATWGSCPWPPSKPGRCLFQQRPSDSPAWRKAHSLQRSVLQTWPRWDLGKASKSSNLYTSDTRLCYEWLE